MESNYPGDTNTNPITQPQPTAPGPKKRWPFSGKITIILAVVLVLVVVTVIFMALGGSKSGNSSDRSTIYIQREGYENLDESIGDPMALISAPSGKVAQYKGRAVVQPCTLLSVGDIRASGLKLTSALQPGAVSSIFLDGQSQQPIQPQISDFGFPFPDDTNSCTYSLEDDDRVTLTTYQDTYASPAAAEREIARSFTPVADTNGVQTFQKKADADDTSTTYLLRASGIINVLELKTTNDTAKDTLLRLAADHTKVAVNTPTPIQGYAYKSPVWTAGKAAKPCDLYNAGSVKAILGKEAGPLVNERVGGVVGVVKDPVNGKLYNYVSGECDRRTAEKNTVDSHVIVQTDTFETEEGAKLIFDYTTKGKFTKNLQNISPVIGDQSFYADTASMEEAIVFRKGRVLVKMTYIFPLGSPAVSAQERIDAMRPVAEAAVSKLSGF